MSNTPTQCEPQAPLGKEGWPKFKPGDRVFVRDADMEGLQGRGDLAVVDRRGEHPKAGNVGRAGTVLRYNGWEGARMGPGSDPENPYSATLYQGDHADDFPLHFYRVRLDAEPDMEPDYDYAEYELEFEDKKPLDPGFKELRLHSRRMTGEAGRLGTYGYVWKVDINGVAVGNVSGATVPAMLADLLRQLAEHDELPGLSEESATALAVAALVDNA